MKSITTKFYDKKAEGEVETRTIPDDNATLEQRINALEDNMILDQQLILENSQRITDLEEIVEELVKKLEQK